MKISINRLLAINPRAYAPDWLKVLFTRIDLIRIAIAKVLLPGKCFVQINPNCVEKMGYFPELRREMNSYNRDTSIAQKSLAVDGNRVIILRMMLRHVASLPTGDYAELGTYRGISARLILRHMKHGRELHCFDTFEGFAGRDTEEETPDVRDRDIEGAFDNTSLKRAERYILDGETDTGRLFLHKGYFPDTFQGLENRSWRFVHLDADLYMPTLEGIKCFYPRLVPGGVMLLHDYYSFFSGVRRAAEEYFSPLDIVVVPLVDKAGTGIVLKPTQGQIAGHTRASD
ncbi:MAG: class I SAM-dependent methyltransferase [Deltaproteobacteria bacterium]|jgi:predicted O-methyltransferase YrrM|nr:class I SAM-dependent methyltransferase [Deltaproteobacteria bacterium]